jgi:hypothetical protein
MAGFQITAHDATPSGGDKLVSITVRLVVKNCGGDIYFTDLMLQGGNIATGWVGHPCELKWCLDG